VKLFAALWNTKTMPSDGGMGENRDDVRMHRFLRGSSDKKSYECVRKMMGEAAIIAAKPFRSGILPVKDTNIVTALLEAHDLLSNARFHAAELLGRL
jgi:hypothetical protein